MLAILFMWIIFLAPICSDDYEKCDDQSRREVMVQMAIEPFVSVRVMRDLLYKVLPDRVYIDRHMINNVRIRSRQRKRELERSNIVIHPKHFDTSFIETYKDTSDNYTEGVYMFVCSFSTVNSKI